jgi:hypothetical protein
MVEFKSPNVRAIIQSTQDFWRVCDETNLGAFEDPSAYPEFQQFKDSLNKVSFDDFFIEPEFRTKILSKDEVEYLDVFKNDHIHVMAIFLPPKAVYPIHDHPQMLGFSKILKGQALIIHYDIIDKEMFYKKISGLKFCELLATQVEKTLLRDNDIDSIYPDKGNLHSIEAVHRTVILDVMFNYYDDSERHCSFFMIGEKKDNDTYQMFYHAEE